MDPRRRALPSRKDVPENPGDDLDLVERAKRRDPAAAEELVRRYQEKAYAVAFRTCAGDAEEARDLTQEAFLRAFRNLHQFEGRASFYTWLYRIVVNTCLDAVRRQKRRRWFFPPLQSDQEEGGGDGSDENAAGYAESDPAADMNRRELKHLVQTALAGLSNSQRMVFEFKVFDEMSIPEIAALMNCAEGTVKSHLFRATQHVRRALKGWAEK